MSVYRELILSCGVYSLKYVQYVVADVHVQVLLCDRALATARKKDGDDLIQRFSSVARAVIFFPSAASTHPIHITFVRGGAVSPQP